MNKIIYQGVFFNFEETKKLATKARINSLLFHREEEFGRGNMIANPHITWTFRPCDSIKIPQSMWGQIIDVRVTHIGFFTNPETGLIENIGFKVDKNDMLPYAGYIKNDIDLLHITLKTSNGGKPINTSKCKWFKITPQVFEGVIGYFADDGKVHFA